MKLEKGLDWGSAFKYNECLESKISLTLIVRTWKELKQYNGLEPDQKDISKHFSDLSSWPCWENRYEKVKETLKKSQQLQTFERNSLT